MVKIAPSILSADFSRLGDELRAAATAGADWIHVDVMDGHFVPNLTIGVPVVAALKPVAREAGMPLDVHLMIEAPERLIPEFAKAGADGLTVHVETCPHLHRTIQQIRELGVRPGVSLNPATPLAAIEAILPFVDVVLVMSVNPGFGGQSYIATSTARIARVRKMLDEIQSRADLEVDGGVNETTASAVVEAGARVLVAGSAVFNNRMSVAENIARLRAAATAVATAGELHRSSDANAAGRTPSEKGDRACDNRHDVPGSQAGPERRSG